MDASESIPVLLDTDIGTDIDDAVALAYLLRQPRCELLGITTVTGEAQVRAQLADAVCRAFGRKDVPVHSGAEQPLRVSQEQPEAPHKTVLGDWPHRTDFQPNSAVDFLRQTVRSRPGEVTLLTIGPLTNIGLLFRLDPEIPSLLKAHVMMGGLYHGLVRGRGPTEHNMHCDPHAAAIVFSTGAGRGLSPGLSTEDGAPSHTATTSCVGLDVSTRCTLPADECRRRFSRGPLRIIGEMAEVWFQQRETITFHDPLAAACLFDPALCRFAPGLVEIELQARELRGLTRFTPSADRGPHQVAVDVRPEAFFEHYWQTLSGC